MLIGTHYVRRRKRAKMSGSEINPTGEVGTNSCMGEMHTNDQNVSIVILRNIQL